MSRFRSASGKLSGIGSVLVAHGPSGQVKGKWPLNVDILMDWMGGRMDYMGEGMVSRLEGAYGQTLNTRVLGEDSVITTSPEHVYQMLDSSFAAFEKGPKWRERVYEMTGDGVFSSDGGLWKYRILEPHTSTYIAVLNSFIPFPGNHDPQVPQAFDIQRITKCLALDVAMSWLCGHTTGLLDKCFGRDQSWDTANNEKSEGVKVFEAFAEAQAVASMRIKAGTLWSLFEWRKNKMAEPMRIIRGFIRPIVIDAVRKQMTEVNGNATKPKASGGAVHAAAETLLDHLVQVLDDPRAIEDEIINILIAASDTVGRSFSSSIDTRVKLIGSWLQSHIPGTFQTAAALTACIYCLVMYPECLARIARESEQVPEEKGRPEDVLRECEYLNAFVHEVLRLYPPVPLK
ncbi:hypothetical protein QFC19_009009 [Naganishia cerealis]|uniref:Uncharacterized protein n=1 Tax=Naganishia cerealis TaxID=610337 RepID=A0ACC2UXH6_9TREE|nr:hypothetical protein QFC19_009009 [Naganishia cerealis]